MSEPWLRVYAADMRGDPEMALVGLAGQALFVHAWDIAKHGPVFGELRDKTGRPYTAASLAAVIPGATPAIVRRWWRAAVERDYAQELDDGALYFPSLQKRQAYDPTNAERQARFRKRRRTGMSNGQSNGGSNAPANSDVTGQSPESRRTDTPSGVSVAASTETERRRNPQWDGLTSVFGYQPTTTTERKQWGRLCQDLAAAAIDQEGIITAAELYELDMHGASLTPPALVKHAPRLLANAQKIRTKANGTPRTTSAAERMLHQAGVDLRAAP